MADIRENNASGYNSQGNRVVTARDNSMNLSGAREHAAYLLKQEQERKLAAEMAVTQLPRWVIEAKKDCGKGYAVRITSNGDCYYYGFAGRNEGLWTGFKEFCKQDMLLDEVVAAWMSANQPA